MRCNWWRWLWGIVPLLVLSWVAVQAEQGRIEADLRERAKLALTQAGMSWAATRFEGRDAILEGLHGAASAPGGTSTPVFAGFPIPIAGKTGTAEHGIGRPDQSWYVALAPYPNPRYVVAVTDEAGGFGADTAAPMARRILAALFDVKESGLVQGGGAPD